MDKAGAYGIQGFGAVLIKGIAGDYYTVVGLPVAEVARRLRNYGILPLQSL
jgi:septum formation protein